MDLKAALVATATVGALLLAACGGDGGQSAGSSSFQSKFGSSGSGSNASTQFVAIDLHSSGYVFTNGSGVAGDEQVGMGYDPSTHPGWFHAVLWRSSASSVVDLHPRGLFDG